MARYPIKQHGLQHQRGFSLIEALFSALILAIALLALAGFHVGAFQDSTLVKSRMAATNLAQEKLDDLRSFTVLKDDPATTAVNECAVGTTFCFSEIATDSGGREITTGVLILPTGSVSGFQDSFSRTWTVTCAATETSGSALSFGTTCAASDVAKLVKVKISWVDSKGADQEVVLQSVIYSMDPANGANAAVGPVSGKGPKISYTPNNESVPIDIGGGKSTETSRPLPEVSGGDSRRVTLPSVVYTGSSGSETVVAKEEFATVNCTCNLKSAAETAWTPHRTVWNGSALEQEKGEQVSKVVGQPSDLSNNGATKQDPLCIECCRDHHDTNATTAASGSAPGYPAYRPYVSVAEFLSGTGDHKHYKADGALASLTTDVYVEACRMKRVDGYWRVAADWQLIDLATYGCDYFVANATNECLPSQPASTTKLETYRTWLKNVLKEFVGYLNTNKTVDTASATLPTFDTTGTVNPLLDKTNASDDISLIIGANKQLITRGIYADTVFKKLSSGTPRAVDTDYVTAVLPVASGDFSKLQYLPFYDANLTLLANWSPTSTNSGGVTTYGDCSKAPGTITYNDGSASLTTPACVTSQAISTVNDPNVNYYTDYYSRGKLHGKVAGSQLITAKVARGNNGLTSSPSIIGATDSVQQRQVTATIPVAGPTVGISGTVVRGNSGANLSNVTITASPSTGVSCVYTSPANTLATTSAAAYSCTVPSTWVGTLTFTSSTSYTFKLKTSTATPTSSYTTASITASSTTPVIVDDVAAYGSVASIKGIVSTNNVPSGNPKPDLAATTISFVGTTNGTCTSVATTAGSGEVTARTYTCNVPVGWTGYVNVDVNESNLANKTGHTYLSPSSSPCDGVTTGSCNMQSIPAVLSDVDGTVSGASTTVQQQTNVTARR